jgi:hypothetical protein
MGKTALFLWERGRLPRASALQLLLPSSQLLIVDPDPHLAAGSSNAPHMRVLRQGVGQGTQHRDAVLLLAGAEDGLADVLKQQCVVVIPHGCQCGGDGQLDATRSLAH